LGVVIKESFRAYDRLSESNPARRRQQGASVDASPTDKGHLIIYVRKILPVVQKGILYRSHI
jgi:hypothetical protein